MSFLDSPFFLLLLLLLGAGGFALLGRGPRATEGRIVALLLPFFLLLAGAALHAKQADMAADHRVNINDPRLDALTLADSVGIPSDLAQQIVAYRNRLSGRVFRTVGQIPSLGRASKEEVQQLEAWAKAKNWPELRRVVRTGKLFKAAATNKSAAPAEGQADESRLRTEGRDETEEFGWSTPVVGRGLFPTMDLQVRAAALLPDPPFTLDRSSRSQLVVALGNRSVVLRVVQARTMDDAPVRHLSDVSSVPESKIVLRSPGTAVQLFVGIMGLLLVVFVAGHLYLRSARSLADPLLWPLFAGMSILGVLMLFAVTPPLTARGNAWPGLYSVPEYVGQGMVVALAMLLLPLAPRLLQLGERVGSRWLGGLLGAAILVPNVLSDMGRVPVLALGAVAVALAAYALQVSRMRSLPVPKKRIVSVNSTGEETPVLPAAEGEGFSSVFVSDPSPPTPWEPPSLSPPDVERSSPPLKTLLPILIPALLLLALVAGLTLARISSGKTGYAPLVELSKVLLILFTARVCSEYEFFLGEGLGDLPARSKWELIGCWLAAMTLALLSNDLGFLLLLWIPFTLLLSLSIGRRWPAVAGLAGLLVGAALLSASGHTRFPERVTAWLDPWDAPSTQMAEAFQRMASVPSVAAGTGLGHGTRLTVSTDARDVILPLYFEHLGWVGLAMVVLLLLLGIHRLFHVGLRAREPFAHWVSLGFGCVFAVQTVYMVGAGFGAWPLTGMTLAPLASGKAAAFFTLLMALLALAASAEPAGAMSVERRSRARFVSVAFAAFAGLMLYSVVKLGKNVVVERQQTALHPIGGASNRRAMAEKASLRTGRIMGRKRGLAYDAGNLAVLAESFRTPAGEERRNYPYAAPSFPVVGVAAEGHRVGGEAEWRNRLTGLDAFLDRSRMSLPPETGNDRLLLDLWMRKRHPLWPSEEKIVPQDAQTTIITRMQQSAYDALKKHLQNTQARSGLRVRKGAMLVADVKTGEVLAYVQYPAPNPQVMSEDYDSIAHDTAGYLDPNGQLVDLVRHTDRAPGSTAKINTMMAFAEAGEAGRTFNCAPGITVNGYPIRDHDNQNHGRVGLREILKYSCNRGASQAADAIGSDALYEQYRRLRYSLPHMTRPEDTFSRYYQQIAFGQVMSSSLWEIGTSVAAVVRGGEAIELHLLKKPTEKVEKWRVCSQRTASLVADGMTAVTEYGGTAYAVYQGRHDWPSKTGSAEVAGAKETDAWFVGYAPRRNPSLAFVVWAEEDGTGSGLARSIGVSSLIEGFLKMIGVSEDGGTASSSQRPQSRKPADESRDWLDEVLERPELQAGRRALEDLRDRIQEQIERGGGRMEDIEKGMEQLRRLQEEIERLR